MTTCASLRIVYPHPNVNDVTTQLGVKPTSASEAGELLSKHKRSARQKDGLWILESPLPETASLSEHCLHLLRELEGKDAAVAALRNKGATLNLFCLYTVDRNQQTLHFGREVVERLARYHCELILDTYRVD